MQQKTHSPVTFESSDKSSRIAWDIADSGDVVTGSGGVRIVRWAADGKGKSGGVRVIYYWKKSDDEIWMLTLYSKSEQATIPGHQLKKIAEAIDNDKL